MRKLLLLFLIGFLSLSPVLAVGGEGDGAAESAIGGGPEFTLNPNPVNGSYFYVDFNFTEKQFSGVSIIITNVLGQVIYTYPVTKADYANGRVRIELADAKLDKGVYVVQLKSGDQTKTQRLAVR